MRQIRGAREGRLFQSHHRSQVRQWTAGLQMMQATKNKRLPHFTGFRLQATTTYQHRHTFRTKYSGHEQTKKFVLSPLFSAPSAHHIGYRLPYHNNIQHGYNFQDRVPSPSQKIYHDRRNFSAFQPGSHQKHQLPIAPECSSITSPSTRAATNTVTKQSIAPS